MDPSIVDTTPIARARGRVSNTSGREASNYQGLGSSPSTPVGVGRGVYTTRGPRTLYAPVQVPPSAPGVGKNLLADFSESQETTVQVTNSATIAKATAEELVLVTELVPALSSLLETVPKDLTDQKAVSAWRYSLAFVVERSELVADACVKALSAIRDFRPSEAEEAIVDMSSEDFTKHRRGVMLALRGAGALSIEASPETPITRGNDTSLNGKVPEYQRLSIVCAPFSIDFPVSCDKESVGSDKPTGSEKTAIKDEVQRILSNTNFDVMLPIGAAAGAQDALLQIAVLLHAIVSLTHNQRVTELKLARMIGYAMNGTALQAWNSCGAGPGTGKDVPITPVDTRLCVFLSKYIASTGAVGNLIDSLLKMRQHRGESFTSYMERLHILLSVMDSKIQHTVLEMLLDKIDALWRLANQSNVIVIKDLIAQALMDQSRGPWEAFHHDVVKAGLQEESVQFGVLDAAQLNVFVGAPPLGPAVNDGCLATGRSGGGNGAPRVDANRTAGNNSGGANRSSGKPKFKGTCHYCQKTGHKAFNCEKKKKDNNNNNNSNNNQNNQNNQNNNKNNNNSNNQNNHSNIRNNNNNQNYKKKGDPGAVGLDCEEEKGDPCAIGLGLDSDGDGVYDVLVVSDARACANGSEVRGITAFVDSASSRVYMGEELAEKLGATYREINQRSATLNGVVEEKRVVDQLQVYLGPPGKEVRFDFTGVRIRSDLPWGLSLLIPLAAFNAKFDSWTNESSEKTVKFVNGDTTVEGTWVSKVQVQEIVVTRPDTSTIAAAAIDLPIVDVSSVIHQKVKQMQEAVEEQNLQIGEELSAAQRAADDIILLEESQTILDSVIEDRFAKANAIPDHKRRILAYATIFENWKDDNSRSIPGFDKLVEEYRELILKHFDRDMGPDALPIPMRMNTTVPYSHNIDPTKRPIVVKNARCGMPGSSKYIACEAMIRLFTDAGLLSQSIPVDEVDSRISVIGWTPVLKNGATDYNVDTIRLTVGGHLITHIMDWKSVPPVVRRSSAMQVLMNATYDPQGESKIFAMSDLKNGYLQGNRMKPKDARVAMLNPDGKSVRLLLGPIYGYPNAGIHFDNAICQSLSPQVTSKCFVDDNLEGKHTAFRFLYNHVPTLRELWDNGNTLSIKKYRVSQSMSKFGAVVSPKGIAMDTQPLQVLLAIPTPKSLADFKSQSHKVLYFGQFIPSIAEAIGTISNYWHQKADMPSAAQRDADWEHVLNLVRNHITINHFDPSLRTFIGMDWSETGEFYVMFQVKEAIKGQISVHIVAHSQKLHKTKYERTAPAFTGELANLTRACRDLEHELSLCAQKPIMLMDCEPIVKASQNDFRALFSIGNKKHQRELMEFLHVYPSLNVEFLHIKREFNPICDFFSYMEVVEPAYRFIQHRTGEASAGELLYSALEIPAGEEEARDHRPDPIDIGAAIVDDSRTNLKPESGARADYVDRLMALEYAADKDPVDEYAICLKMIKDGVNIDLDSAELLLHKEDYDSIVSLNGKPELIEFRGGKILVRGEVYVPPNARFETIRKAHSIPEVGHFAYNMTMHNLQGLHCPGKELDVEAFIALCGACDRENNSPQRVVPRPNAVHYPFEKIYMDFKPAGDDNDVSGFIIVKESVIGVVMVVSTDSKESGAWIRATMKWIATYGPFEELTTDRDGAVRSNAFQEFAKEKGFIVRPTSSYNKSNGNVEAEMKLINWYLAKTGGDQSNLNELSDKMAIALNSRCRFRCAGLFFNAHGLIRGFYSRSIAQRTAGMDLQQITGRANPEFNFVDWIVNALKTRGQYIKQNLGRRGVQFAPEDLVDSEYPRKYPVGTLVWVLTKVLPKEIAGTRKTTAKGTGPFEIIAWEESGMTAKLREVAKPKHVITRNVRFFYPVNVEEKDAIGAKDYVVEEILGEKRRGRKVVEYLIHFAGYGAERAEWISADSLSADDLLEAWNRLSLEERKERTTKAIAMQAKDSPAIKTEYQRSKVGKQQRANVHD